MKKEMRLVQCTVNGKEVAEYVDVRESLLDMLRNRLGQRSFQDPGTDPFPQRQ